MFGAMWRNLYFVDYSLVLFSFLLLHRGRGCYSRDFYPDYCSDQKTMSNRKIPPLPETFIPLSSSQSHVPSSPDEVVAESEGTLQSQILQSIVIFRHGARTPYTPLSCWHQYVAEWNCSLMTLMAPRQRAYINNDATILSDDNSSLFFEKQYTALKPPQSNFLNGTCSLGQLIEKGRDQMQMNGQYIREAYITNDKQPHLRLFESVYYSKRPYDEAIYLRSDDMQRTLTSCQVLFQGIFDLDEITHEQEDVIIPIHTGDLERDILDMNEEVCPNLKKIKLAAVNSGTYKERMQSKETQQLLNILTQTIGASPDMQYNGNFIDCMMTSYCTDRPMPYLLLQNVDEHNIGSSMFQKFLEFFTWEYYYHVQWQQGLYAKLAMGPLWNEILTPIRRAKNCRSRADMQSQKIPRLLLFSGHDDTLTPLLISLGVWDQNWTAYASMLIIEVHVIKGGNSTFPSGHAFRLLYNGKVISDKITGCLDDLCDLDILLHLTEPYATTFNQSCTGEILPVSLVQQLDTQVRISVVVLTALFFALFGGAVTALAVNWRRKRDLQDTENHMPREISLQYGTNRKDYVATVGRPPFTIDEEEDDEHDHELT